MMQALTVLGYRVTGPNHARDKDIAKKLERVTAELSVRQLPQTFRGQGEHAHGGAALQPPARFLERGIRNSTRAACTATLSRERVYKARLFERLRSDR
jgi:hypothetical protein